MQARSSAVADKQQVPDFTVRRFGGYFCKND